VQELLGLVHGLEQAPEIAQRAQALQLEGGDLKRYDHGDAAG
jgi:hypothetical protein